MTLERVVSYDPFSVKIRAALADRHYVTVSNDIRWQLIALARSRRTRSSQFSPSRPTHWAPYEVRRPDSGEAFTADGAWNFIVELLEGGCDIEEIVLAQPPGRRAYVILVDGWAGDKIYIKLQLGGGVIIGRSFHMSKR